MDRPIQSRPHAAGWEGRGRVNTCRRIEHVDPNDPAKVSAFEMLWAEIEGQRRTRAADMPTEQRAIRHLFDAWYRLKELGWR